MNAEQIHYSDHGVVAVGWKEMDGTMVAQCILTNSAQCGHGLRLCPHALSHVGNALYAAVPYDVFYIYVVSDECVYIVVDVNHTHESIAVLSEIIEERGVLSEGEIGVGGIVGRRLIVAKQYYHSAFDQSLEFIPSIDISFFTKHVEKL